MQILLAESSQRLDVIPVGEDVKSGVAQEYFGVVFIGLTVDVASRSKACLRAGDLKFEPSFSLRRH